MLKEPFLPLIEDDAQDDRMRRRATSVVLSATAALTLLLTVVGYLGFAGARLVGRRTELRVEQRLLAYDLSNRMRECRYALWVLGRYVQSNRQPLDPEVFKQRYERALNRLTAATPVIDHPAVEEQWRLAESKTQAFLAATRAAASAPPQARNTEAIDNLLVQSRDELRATLDVLSQVADEREDQISLEALQVQRAALVLVLLCVALALIGSIVSVRFVTVLFRRLEANKEAMTRISGMLLEKQEEAAQRFSQELHDELGQNLTALKADLRRMSRAEPPEQFEERKQRSLEILDQTIASTRNLSQLMHPRVLDDLGLAAALEWLAEGFSERTGIEVEHEIRISRRLAPGLRHQLFRIAQEALTNIARHAGATKAGIFVTERGGAGQATITLRVTDNGGGLSSTSVTTTGLGLAGMRARALMVGGALRLVSHNGSGVEIEVTAPAVRQDE